MPQPPAQLSPEQAQRLADAPVGRLSTASSSGEPHVIPVCFTLGQGGEGPVLYIVLDQKPKRTALTRLRRVRNILENPRVALVVDHYDEDWTQLWYILITGNAELLEGDAPPEPESSDSRNLSAGLSPGSQPVEGTPEAETAQPGLVPARPKARQDSSASDEIALAIRLLRNKYPQYRDMDIDGNPVIKITPRRVVSWSYSQ